MAVISPISRLGGKINIEYYTYNPQQICHCSIGTCHNYLRHSNLCNSFFESIDYIFTTMDQLTLSTKLDERLLYVLSDDGECGDLMSRLLCHYFFAPCGADGQLHLPLALCQEECQYVQSTCENQWRRANNLLSIAGLGTVSCSSTGSLLQGLALCCIDAGIATDISTDISKNYYPLSLSLSLSLCDTIRERG